MEFKIHLKSEQETKGPEQNSQIRLKLATICLRDIDHNFTELHYL